MFTADIGLTLMSITNNAIPTSWKALLPFPLAHCPELVPALKLLKIRIEFYTRVLESVTLPSIMDPSLFSNPEDMISRILHRSLYGSQLSTEVQLDAKVYHNYVHAQAMCPCQFFLYHLTMTSR